MKHPLPCVNTGGQVFQICLKLPLARGQLA
jgi:hypothetical protein